MNGGRRTSGDATRPAIEPAPRYARFGLIALAAVLALIALYPAHRHRFFSLWAASAAVLVLHQSVVVAVAVAVGLRILRVSLSYGGTIFRRRVGATWVTVGWLPLGGHVKLEGEDSPAGRAAEPGTWNALPAPVRVVMPLVAPSCLIGFGAALIGLRPAGRLLADVLRQFVAVWTEGPGNALAESAVRAIDAFQFHRLVGSLAVIVGGWDLLPIPALNGGRALMELLKAAAVPKLPSRVIALIDMVGFLFFLSFALVLGYRFIKAWWIVK